MEQKAKRRQVIEEYLLGGTTTRKLAEKYECHYSTVSRWTMGKKEKKKESLLRKTSEPQTARVWEELPKDVAGLEQELYLMRIRLELLEAVIDIADEQFGTDMRKKAGTRQS